MKIAFTHNLRLTDSEEEAEFDSAETVDESDSTAGDGPDATSGGSSRADGADKG